MILDVSLAARLADLEARDASTDGPPFTSVRSDGGPWSVPSGLAGVM